MSPRCRGFSFKICDGMVIRKLVSDDPHIRFLEPVLTDSEKSGMWNSIKKETAPRNGRLPLSPRRIAVWAACAAAVALLGVFTWVRYGEKHSDIDYTAIVAGGKGDFDVTAKDVELRLSGDQSVKVQNEHADVTYDRHGTPAVNSLEIISRGKEPAKIDQLLVPFGKTASLTLGDGTRIRVNSGSRLIYRSVFEEKKREVYLTGEAYFEVAKDENRPFVIKTDGIDVVIRGTTLNVSAYDGDPLRTVALVSGRVDVEGNDGKTTYRMEPDQLFSYDRAVDRTEIRNVDVEEYTAWTRGYLLTRRESLDIVLFRIGRHFNVRIDFDARDMQGIRVNGKLELEKGIEKVFEYIGATAPIVWRLEEGEARVDLKR